MNTTTIAITTSTAAMNIMATFATTGAIIASSGCGDNLSVAINNINEQHKCPATSTTIIRTLSWNADDFKDNN